MASEAGDARMAPEGGDARMAPEGGDARMAPEGGDARMAPEGGDVRLRAAWLGCGALYSRRTLGNAAAWTAQQNREYEAAFAEQERDIATALARESAPAKERRTSDAVGAATPRAQRRLQQEDHMFDLFWPIKELENGMQFRKGLISGLEQSRDRNETLLAASKRELVALQAQHGELLLEFRAQHHHHLQRHGVNVFKREVEGGGDGGAGRKRGRGDGRVECVGVDFWCLNLKSGLEILVEDAAGSGALERGDVVKLLVDSLLVEGRAASGASDRSDTTRHITSALCADTGSKATGRV